MKSAIPTNLHENNIYERKKQKDLQGNRFFCLDFNELAPSPVSWPSISLLGTQCVPCMEGNDENDGGD